MRKKGKQKLWRPSLRGNTLVQSHKKFQNWAPVQALGYCTPRVIARKWSETRVETTMLIQARVQTLWRFWTGLTLSGDSGPGLNPLAILARA